MLQNKKLKMPISGTLASLGLSTLLLTGCGAGIADMIAKLTNTPIIYSLAISSSTVIGDGNKADYRINGTCKANETDVHYSITDGVIGTPLEGVLHCTGNAWTSVGSPAIDLTALLDGNVIVTLTQVETVGVAPTTVTATLLKDVYPLVISSPVANAQILDSATNATAYTVSGTCKVPGTSNVTLTAATLAEVTADCTAGHTWTKDLNLNALTNGTFNITASQIRSGRTSTSSVGVEMLRTRLTITAPGSITGANAATYSMSGTCRNRGVPVFYNIANASGTPVTNVGGAGAACTSANEWTATDDLSTLANGPVTITLTQEGTVAVPANVVVTKAAYSLSFIAPAADVTLLNTDNFTAYPVSGACSYATEDTVHLSAVDTSAISIPLVPAECTINNTWADVLNLSRLNNSSVTISAVQGSNTPVTNTYLSISRTNLAITVPATSTTITGLNAGSYTMSGTCRKNVTPVSYTVLDATSHTVSGTTACSANGWSATGVNLSTLTDGPITFSVTQEEDGGSKTAPLTPLAATKTVTATSIAITNKPTSLRGELEATTSTAYDNTYINESNAAAFKITGTCLGDAAGGAVSISLGTTGRTSKVLDFASPCTCASGLFSCTTVASKADEVGVVANWTNGTHTLTATITPVGVASPATSSPVTIYSYQLANTADYVKWSTQIKPLFANPSALGADGSKGNLRTCIDCHSRGYSSDSAIYTDGSGSNSFGEWAPCAATGGNDKGGVAFNGHCTVATAYTMTGTLNSTDSDVISLVGTATTLADTDIEAGMVVSGNYIPNPTQATMSAAAATGVTNTSATIILNSLVKTLTTVGMGVSGFGIPAGATVTGVTPGASTTTVTISFPDLGSAPTPFAASTIVNFTIAPTTVLSSVDTTNHRLVLSRIPTTGATSGTTLTFSPKHSLLNSDLTTPSDRGLFKFQFGYFDNQCTPILKKITVAIAGAIATIAGGDNTTDIIAGSATTGMKVFYYGATFGNTYVTAKDATTFTLGVAPTTPSGTYTMSFFPAGSSCANGSSALTASYKKGISIVNEEVVDVTRNKIVRGNPGQSIIYNRVIASANPIATRIIAHILNDLFMPLTGPAGSPPFIAATATTTSKMMPNGGPNYMDSTRQELLRKWIVEGARTDN